MDPRGAVTAAGRRRVEAVLERTGLLLVQGQAEIPSVADVLAGAPITTRGYSWDYAPAWNLTDDYERRDDVAVVKLFRGRRTIVTRRLWPAVDVLAEHARAGVLGCRSDEPARRVLEAVERQPGLPLSAVPAECGFDRRTVDRVKRNLDQWL